MLQLLTAPNNLKSHLKKLFSSNNFKSPKSIFLLIVLLSFLTMGKVFSYFFSYEDLFLIYGFRFPGDKNDILNTPEIVGYRFLGPFLYPQYILFGLNPLGYYVVLFLLFLLMSLVFYYFVKILCEKNSSIPLISTIIFISGYIGIEAFIWNVAGGQNAVAFLIIAFLTLICISLYAKTSAKKYLFFITLGVFLTVYLFQSRSYLLIVWLILLIIKISLFSSKKFSKWFYLYIFLICFVSFVFFSQTIQKYLGNDITLQSGIIKFIGMLSGQGKVVHLDMSVLELFKVITRNLGNLILPSDMLSYLSDLTIRNIENTEFIAGIIVALIMFGIIFFTLVRKYENSHIILFSGVAVFTSLALIHLAVGYTNISPTVWRSEHRFYLMSLPFVSLFIASFLTLIKDRFSKLTVVLFLFWVISHIYLSNQIVDQRWKNLNSHLRYFYTTISKYMPTVDKDTVVLLTEGSPTPVSIFVPGIFVNSRTGLAGYYNIKVEDLNIASSSLEAAKLMRDKNLDINKLFAFNYRRGELIDKSGELREILKSGKKVPFNKQYQGENIEVTNLSLPAFSPLFVELDIKAVSDFTNLYGTSQEIKRISDPNKYFSVFFNQEAIRKRTKVSSENQPLGGHKIEDIIDGLYETTWIPYTWTDKGVSVLIDLGKITMIDRVIWSSSRTATWYIRLPSEYDLEISTDGKNFTLVKSETDAPILETGQYFIDDIGEHETRFLKLTIKKTRGGRTPAIDEIEVLNNNEGKIDYSKYMLVKQTPKDYLSNSETARRYLNEILNGKVAIGIDWKVDENTDYPAGNFITANLIVDTNFSKLRVYLPVSGIKLKSLRIRAINYPTRLFINNFSLNYPNLEELKQLEILN